MAHWPFVLLVAAGVAPLLVAILMMATHPHGSRMQDGWAGVAVASCRWIMGVLAAYALAGLFTTLLGPYR